MEQIVKKIIIENKDGLSDKKALELVLSVIRQGRISNNNKQYCYVTSSKINHKTYVVTTSLNQKSDRFVITRDIEADMYNCEYYTMVKKRELI